MEFQRQTGVPEPAMICAGIASPAVAPSDCPHSARRMAGSESGIWFIQELTAPSAYFPTEDKPDGRKHVGAYRFSCTTVHTIHDKVANLEALEFPG